MASKLYGPKRVSQADVVVVGSLLGLSRLSVSSACGRRRSQRSAGKVGTVLAASMARK